VTKAPAGATGASGAIETVDADVLVIGAGAAGLTAALGCMPRRVVVLTKTRLSAGGAGGASVWAQGGVASAVGEDDDPALHAADTLAAGAGLNDAAIVRLLTGEGPGRIRALLDLGAQFDRDAGGRLALGREAAHSRRRILHAHGDATGAEVVRTLVEAVRQEPGIHLVDETFALDLALSGGAVVGLLARHADGRQVLYRAPAVVLATGGLGQLFLYTTNPREATADGLAMAARAGARLVDLEFVQFHPTALAVGTVAPEPATHAGRLAEGRTANSDLVANCGTEANSAQNRGTQAGSTASAPILASPAAAATASALPPASAASPESPSPLPLLTEALRGEGAVLVDERGVRFMERVHPDRELAPRDVVARAIWAELRAGHRVYLDARTAVGDRFPEHFPTVFALCMQHGLDPRTELMPVVPAAHYHMGGVAVDASGRTSLPGLWACGEVAATGAHGANRLASNSLLEALVFGARVATDVTAALDRTALPPADPAGQVDAAARQPDFATGATDVAPRPSDAEERSVAQRVRRILWEQVGVERDEAGLSAAVKELRELARLHPAIDGEARNLLTAGSLVAQAALARRESRGGHFRLDYPHADPAWQHRLFLTASPDGEARFEGVAPATAASASGAPAPLGAPAAFGAPIGAPAAVGASMSSLTGGPPPEPEPVFAGMAAAGSGRTTPARLRDGADRPR
jgi:L-aspartate oxidase